MISDGDRAHEWVPHYPSSGGTLYTMLASVLPLTFFLLLLRQLLENFLQVSEGLKAGGLRSCASAEFHKIIDHISTA